MALAYRASGAFTEANSTSSGSIGLPAGLADGDILILPVQARGTGGTVATPSGYTRAGEINITASHRLVVFYKYVSNAAGEAAPTVTQTVSGAIRARLSAFSGGSSTTQLDVSAVFAKSRDAATVTAPTATPVSAGAMAVWIFSTGDDNTLNAATQGTTAYSSDGTAGADGSLALVYELQTNATAVGTCSMTESANGPDNWNTATLILRPAPVAAPNPSYSFGRDGITVAVEMAFGATPFAPDPTWTDITADLRGRDGITINRGRTSEFSDVQPGTFSFVLNNRARKYDPEYSSGTYYGQLVPQTRCRVRVRWNSTNYTLADGYIQGWPQSYDPSNRDATVPITCVDLFSRLQTRKLPPTALSLAVLADDPDVYYPLYEDNPTIDGPTVDLSGNGRDSSYHQFSSLDTFLPGEPGQKAKGVDLVGASQVRTPFFGAGDTLTLLRSFEVWLQGDALTTTGGVYSAFNVYGYSVNSQIRLSLFGNSIAGDTTPTIYIAIHNESGTEIGYVEATVPQGVPLHLAGVLADTGDTFTAYLNGQAIGTVNTAATAFEGGALTGVCKVEVANTTEARIGHIALYETSLSAARVLAHYGAGVTGGKLETAPDRMATLADFCGLVDAGLYSATNFATNTYLGRASYSGTALTAMQSILRTEQGRLFVSKDGVLTAQGRTADTGALSSNSTSQATLSDSGSYAYVEVENEANTLELMRNSIYVSTVGGATVPVIDFDARAQYDELEDSVSTELDDPTAARNLGLARLRRLKAPSTRIPHVRLIPNGASDQRYAVIFGAELGWRWTLSRTPMGLGSAISKVQTIEGIQIRFFETHIEADFYSVPAPNTNSQQPWFTFGTGEFGSTYLLHY